MGQIKFKNNKNQIVPTKGRIGNVAPGITGDDVTIVSQTTLLGGNNVLTGTNTFSNVLGVTTDVITANAATFITTNRAIASGHTTSAANATATLTAAQVVTGYITSTSAAPTTLTLPTGTLLGAALGATQGTIHDLFIDNTAGASTITIAVAVNGIISAAATAGAGAGAGLLTVPSGVTGQGCFRLMFSSATAYTFSRIS